MFSESEKFRPLEAAREPSPKKDRQHEALQRLLDDRDMIEALVPGDKDEVAHKDRVEFVMDEITLKLLENDQHWINAFLSMYPSERRWMYGGKVGLRGKMHGAPETISLKHVGSISAEEGTERPIIHNEQVREWHAGMERLRQAVTKLKHKRGDTDYIDQKLRDFEIVLKGIIEGKEMDDIGADLAENRPSQKPLSRESARKLYEELHKHFIKIFGAQLPEEPRRFKKIFGEKKH